MRDEYLELTYTTRKKNHYAHVDLSDDTIWIDTITIPPSAFLCAAYDGEPMRISECGPNKEKRHFLKIDWVINGWGGDPEIVKEIIKGKNKILENLSKMKREYPKVTQE